MKSVTPKKREQGVTLVELMIVIAILGVVMAATYNMFEFQQKSYTVQDQVAVMQQNARVGLDYMVREIRMAGYVPEDIPPNDTAPTTDASGLDVADGASESIEEATASTIAFQADVDDDGATETVRYELDGTDLKRSIWEWDFNAGDWVNPTGALTVADNIESINFTYLLSDGSGGLVARDLGADALDTPGERADIRQITLTMTARTQNPDSVYTHSDYKAITSPTEEQKRLSHYRRKTLTSRICLRNMKN